MTKKILLRGPGICLAGYSVHFRQVARWLFDVIEPNYDVEIYTELLPWGTTPWITDTTIYDGLIGKLIQCSGNPQPFYDITIQLQLPSEFNPFLGKYNIGVTAGVETDICNPQWVDCINRMDCLVVPSEFTKSVFTNTGEVTVPIKVIPEAYINSISNKDNIKPLDLDLSTDFNFLLVGQITGNNPENDRKNIPYTLKWFVETFKEEKDVGLVIKTGMARMTVLDRYITTNIFNKMLTDLKAEGFENRIKLLHGLVSDEEMVGLYTHPKIKALLCLSRGEGYNLPAIESVACGLPVIATGWSAHTEFLGLGKYISVEYRLDKVHPSRVDNSIFMPEAKWAYPNEIDAKRKMYRFYQKPDLPKQWAKELQPKILADYSQESINKIYTEHFKEILI